MRKADYKFKCLDDNSFKLDLTIKTKGKMFTKVWGRIVNKINKKQGNIDKDFIKEVTMFNLNTLDNASQLKIIYEGQSRKIVRDILDGISKRANLVFYEWKVDDIVFTKDDLGDWDIMAVYKGIYARKE